eukprot:4631839-Prymnesium_polylepis.1
MHKQLFGMAGAAAAHAVALAEVSDDQRAHFGAPLLVLLHRGGMACWICETSGAQFRGRFGPRDFSLPLTGVTAH